MMRFRRIRRIFCFAFGKRVDKLPFSLVRMRPDSTHVRVEANGFLPSEMYNEKVGSIY